MEALYEQTKDTEVAHNGLATTDKPPRVQQNGGIKSPRSNGTKKCSRAKKVS